MSNRTDQLEADLAIEKVNEAYMEAKAAGQERVDTAREKAFNKAKTATEYQAAVADIPPALSNEEKLEHRAAVQEYRERWRGPPKAGGAAPETFDGSATVEEVG